MNLKLKAALYAIIPYLGTAIWLFSLATWYLPTLLFTMVFLLFVALPFALYNIVYLNLKGKQDRLKGKQDMEELLAKNKKASDRVQEILDSMKLDSRKLYSRKES